VLQTHLRTQFLEIGTDKTTRWVPKYPMDENLHSYSHPSTLTVASYELCISLKQQVNLKGLIYIAHELDEMDESAHILFTIAVRQPRRRDHAQLVGTYRRQSESKRCQST